MQAHLVHIPHFLPPIPGWVENAHRSNVPPQAKACVICGVKDNALDTDGLCVACFHEGTAHLPIADED